MSKTNLIDENVVADNIRTLRNNQGMTQKMLSDISGIGMSSISRIENHLSLPDSRDLIVLSAALHTSVGCLFNESISVKDSILLHQFRGDLANITSLLNDINSLLQFDKNGEFRSLDNFIRYCMSMTGRY